MPKFQLTLFDKLLALVLVIGLLRGRKRGISEELLDVIEWIGIVVGGSIAYRFLGGLLVQYAKFPAILANIFAYLFSALIIAYIFKSFKRLIGEKLVQGDVFGRFEFYLGMVAGTIRYFCIAIFVLAILYAKYSTDASRAAFAKLQRDNLGDISFPTIDEMRYSVFYKSFSGSMIRSNLSMVLIQPVPPEPERPANTIGRRRENAVNEIIK